MSSSNPPPPTDLMDEPAHTGLVDELVSNVPVRHRWWVLRYLPWVVMAILLLVIGLLLLIWRLPTLLMTSASKQQIITALVSVLEAKACPYAKPAFCKASVEDIDADWQWPGIWVSAAGVTLSGPYYPEADAQQKPPYPALDFLSIKQAKVWLNTFSVLRGGKVKIHRTELSEPVFLADSLVSGPPLQFPTQSSETNPFLDTAHIPVRLIEARHILRGAPDVLMNGDVLVLTDQLKLEGIKAIVGGSLTQPTHGSVNVSGQLQYEQTIANPLTLTLNEVDMAGVWPWVQAFLPLDMPSLVRNGRPAGELNGTVSLAGPLSEPNAEGTLHLNSGQWFSPDGKRLLVLDNARLVSKGQTMRIPQLSGVALEQAFSGKVSVNWANVTQPGSNVVVNAQGVNISSLLTQLENHVFPYVSLGSGTSASLDTTTLKGVQGDLDVHLDATLAKGHWSPSGQIIVRDLHLNSDSSLSAMLSVSEERLTITQGVLRLTPGKAMEPVVQVPLNRMETVSPEGEENSAVFTSPVIASLDANGVTGDEFSLRPAPYPSGHKSSRPETTPPVEAVRQVSSGELLLEGDWSNWWLPQNQVNMHAPIALSINAQQVPLQTLVQLGRRMGAGDIPDLVGRVTGHASARLTPHQITTGSVASMLPQVQGTFNVPALQFKMASGALPFSPNGAKVSSPQWIKVSDAALALSGGTLSLQTAAVQVGQSPLGQQLTVRLPLTNTVVASLGEGNVSPALSVMTASFCSDAISVSALSPLLSSLDIKAPPALATALNDGHGTVAGSLDWENQQVDARLAFLGIQFPVVDATTQHTLATLSNLEGLAQVKLAPNTGRVSAALSELEGDVFTASQHMFALSAKGTAEAVIDTNTPAGGTAGSESTVLANAWWQGRIALQPKGPVGPVQQNTVGNALVRHPADQPVKLLASAELKTQGTLANDGHVEISDTTLQFSDMGTVAVSAFMRPEGQLDNNGNELPLWDAYITTPEGPLQLETLIPNWLAPWVPTASPLYNKPVLSQQGGGTLALDVRVAGHNKDDTLLVGDLSLKDAKLPLLSIRDADLDLTFTGVDSQLSLSHMAIPGVEVDAITAHVTDTLLFPFHLENVQGHADLFVLNGWERWIKQDITDNLINGLMIPITGPPPPEQKAAPVPVVFYNAPISVNETVYDNILLENLVGKLSIHETGFVELTETRADVADGKVGFSLSLDPLKNNYTAATLQADNVSANAMARALLDASNQIFGSIDGTIQFATEGDTQEIQFSNTNGTANFTIEDGRLPAITRVETLLSAANVIRGGVLGLSLNNVLRLVNPFEDDYFAALSGSVALKQGVAYTDDILSDGENLDLLIEGNVKLVDGYSDLTVYGDMTQNVDGKLGTLGKLSLNSLLRKIPGLGYLPFGSKNKGLLAYIPGVGYVPGLGGAPSASTRFQVELEGTLDDPDVLKGFKWLP